MDAKKRRFQVNRDRLIELALGQVIDAAHDRHPGVVDQNVDRTQRRCDLVNHRRDSFALGYVGRDCYCATTHCFDLCDNGVGFVNSFPIIDRHSGASFGKSHGDCSTNPTRSSRYQRGARAQVVSDDHGPWPVDGRYPSAVAPA